MPQFRLKVATDPVESRHFQCIGILQHYSLRTAVGLPNIFVNCSEVFAGGVLDALDLMIVEWTSPHLFLSTDTFMDSKRQIIQFLDLCVSMHLTDGKYGGNLYMDKSKYSQSPAYGGVTFIDNRRLLKITKLKIFFTSF